MVDDSKDKCDQISNIKGVNEDKELQISLEYASTKFASNLYSEIRKEKMVNYVYSPFGLQSALGMLFLGARGKTMLQISNNIFPPIQIGEENNNDPFNAHKALQRLTNSLRPGNKTSLSFNVANRLYINKASSIDPSFSHRKNPFFVYYLIAPKSLIIFLSLNAQ